MIQLAEDVDGYDARKVPIDPSWTRVLIEVASNRKIDIAVVNAVQAKAFEDSDTGDDVDIDWVMESTRQHDFEIEQSGDRKNKQFLILWNANEDKPAIVAYKFTPLPRNA